MQDRHLDAAAGLEPEYGPRMRRLYKEIARLQRLCDLPVAAQLPAEPQTTVVGTEIPLADIYDGVTFEDSATT
jgi:hypothetical protein